MNFINISGPVTANTIYVAGRLVAKNVTVTLPEVTPSAVDVQAMGTMSLPVWSLLENMELAVTKIGIDLGLRDMLKPESNDWEIRFVQLVTDAEGRTKEVGCKAFLRGIPAKLPGIGITIGESSENECTVNITRYQLIADGEEMFLIDRLASIMRIAGTDYVSNMESML